MVQLFHQDGKKSGAVQIQYIVLVFFEILETQQDIFIGVEAALFRMDFFAELIQDIPDQGDEDVLFGAVVPIEGCPRDARAAYQLSDMDIRQDFFLHEGKKRLGDALLDPQICFFPLVHGASVSDDLIHKQGFCLSIVH